MFLQNLGHGGVMVSRFWVFFVVFGFFGAVFGLDGAWAHEKAQWTLLVFMNADNNLHDAGLDDLREMQAVGSTKDINIVVQFDGKNLGDSRRYFIEKGRRKEVYDFSDQASSGEVDMGSANSLIDFALWGIQEYPAHHYFLTVWDHGSGWLKDHRTGAVRLKDGAQLQGISYDDESANHMSTPELGHALEVISSELGRPIDIYGSDACLMGMVEVAYELSPYADVVIGAESTEPFDGWPYDDFLAEWVEHPFMSKEHVASSLVDLYGRSYDGGSQGSSSTTLSAIRSAFLLEFMEYTQALVWETLQEFEEHPELIRTAAKKATRFDYQDNMDLADFFLRVASDLGSTTFFEPFEAWWNLYHSYLLIHNIEVGTKFDGAKGLAVWSPRYVSSLRYKMGDYLELRFAQETNWLDWLKTLHDLND